MEADIRSCSIYCGIFGFLMIVEMKLFKTLAVSLSFFKILFPSTSYLFTGHNIVRQQWFNYFPFFFIFTYMFYTQILIIFSFTFSQNCNTQVLLFVIIDFIFVTPIFEKNIPQSCPYHNCFRLGSNHKRRMIASYILLF